MNAKLAATTALLLVGGLAGCGSGGEDRAVAAEQPAGVPAAKTTTVSDVEPTRTDYDNIPGMAMGSPPESAQMNCTETSCDLVFIAPTDAVVKPFGMTVKLLKSTEKSVTLSVDGTEQSVVPGTTESVKGATVKVVGTPGTVVTLLFTKK